MKKFAIITAAVVMLLTVLSSCGEKSIAITGFPVQLGEGGDSYGNINVVCDLDALTEKLGNAKAYLYGPAEETDYRVASRLGFNEKNHRDTNGGMGRSYIEFSEEINATAKLEIDKYGSFLYESGYVKTETDFPYSVEEVLDMGRDILKGYGVWDGNFRLTSYNEERIYDKMPGEPKITGRDAKFFRVAPDGRDIYNEAATVKINADGKTVEILFDARHYKNRNEAQLIPVAEAFAKADIGRALVGLPEEPSELVFDSIDIVYWSAQNADGEYILQPLYRFGGTTADGIEYFTIVQANRVE